MSNSGNLPLRPRKDNPWAERIACGMRFEWGRQRSGGRFSSALPATHVDLGCQCTGAPWANRGSS
eukprot:4875912-Alexandrium_andersonii.AAC.1